MYMYPVKLGAAPPDPCISSARLSRRTAHSAVLFLSRKPPAT